MFIHKQGEAFYVCVYLLLLLLGVIEAFVVHMICNEELKKVGYSPVESENETPKWIDVCLIVFLAISVVLSIINEIYFCYCLPFVIAFAIPSVIEFICIGKRRWIYFLVGLMFVVNLYIFSYIDPIFYPAFLVGMALPILIDKFIRVLYTNLLKYSNK